jgi:hypothetical protein
MVCKARNARILVYSIPLPTVLECGHSDKFQGALCTCVLITSVQRNVLARYCETYYNNTI